MMSVPANHCESPSSPSLLGAQIFVFSPQLLPRKGLSEQSKSEKDFKLYDAIPTEQAPIITTDEVDKFLPLLNAYLKRQLPCFLSSKMLDLSLSSS
jgi:hypothetical protein